MNIITAQQLQALRNCITELYANAFEMHKGAVRAEEQYKTLLKQVYSTEGAT